MKTRNFTKSESIILISLFLSASDGNIDDKELEVIIKDEFFSKHYNSSTFDLFIELIKQEKSFIDLIKNECSKSFKNPSKKFQEDFIESLVRLVIADDEVEENELVVLNLAGEIIGLNQEEVLDLMKNYNKKQQQKLKKIKEENSSSCFVVTATMGDDQHPVVNDFRFYRDNSLSNNIFGEGFIRIYYLIGPFIANIIRKDYRLREFSFKYLIYPIHKYLNKKNKFK